MYLKVGPKIAVTGADGSVGRAVLERLLGTRARTIALTRGVHELPSTRTVVGPLDSPGAEVAIKESDYVVHLAGTLYPLGANSYHAANVGTAQAVARAVRGSKVKRILFLSYVGASEDAKNPYLRMKGIAERLLAETGKELVVFRCTHIIGSPEAPGPTGERMISRKPPIVLGTGRQMVAPVYVGDVISALEAAMTGGSAGIYELAGPEPMSLDELVRLLNRDPKVPIRHIPPWLARVLGRIVPGLPGPLVDVMLSDSLGDSSRATAQFRVKPTSLRSIWS